MPEVPSPRVVDRHELRKRFGISYSRRYLYVLEQRGQFPKHFRLSPHRPVWLEADILAWLGKRIADSISAPADTGEPAA